MSDQKAYYHWINYLKVLSIFGVVYIHTNSNPQLALSTIYFRFGVPIFIMVSFFLAERHALSFAIELPVLSYLHKRITRLLVPYFFWSGIYCWVNFRSSYPSIYKFLTVHWIGFGWSGQYYLIMMIQLTLLYPFVRRIDLSLKKLLFILVFTLLFVYIPLNYLNLFPIIEGLSESIFVYWFFYMIFAIYIARYYEKMKSIFSSISLLKRLVIILSLPLLMVVESILVSPFNAYINPYFCLSTLVVSPLIFLLMIGFKLRENNSLTYRKIFCLPSNSALVSDLTLGVFCLNPIVIFVLTSFNPAFYIYSKFNNFTGLISKTIIVLLISMLVSSIFVKMGASKLVK